MGVHGPISSSLSTYEISRYSAATDKTEVLCGLYTKVELNFKALSLPIWAVKRHSEIL